MRNLKFIVALLAVAALLVACGGGSEPVADDTPAETSEPPASPDETEDEPTETESLEQASVKVTFPSESITDIAHHAAMAKGYYEDEALDVTFEYGPPNVTTQALIGGEFDFSAAASGPALTAIMQGASLKIVLGAYDVLPFELWGAAELTSVEDLAGKRIAIEGPSTLSETVVLSILEEHGLSASDVEFVSVGAVPNWYGSLQGGSADAAIVPNAIIQKLAEKEGFSLLAEAPEYVDGFLSGLVATDSTVQDRADVVQRYIDATLRGFEDYMSDPEFGAEVILSLSPPPVTEEDAASIYESDVQLRPENLRLSDDTVLSMMQILADLEDLEAPDSVEDVVDWSFVEAASG